MIANIVFYPTTVAGVQGWNLFIILICYELLQQNIFTFLSQCVTIFNVQHSEPPNISNLK